MAESVRRDVLGDAGEASVFFDDTLDAAGSDAAVVARSGNFVLMARVIEKKRCEGIGASVEIIADAVGGGLGDKNRAVLGSFAADHELATIEVDGIAVETDEFGDTEAARV